MLYTPSFFISVYYFFNEKFELCDNLFRQLFRQQQTDDFRFCTKQLIWKHFFQNTKEHMFWLFCHVIYEMLALWRNSENGQTVPADPVQSSYWLQSQERHINKPCFSPLGYSPSWATHASFVSGVNEFEVVSAVSDSPALSVIHGLLLGLLPLVQKSVPCEDGSMMKTSLKTHAYTLHQSKVYNTWRELPPSIPIQLLSSNCNSILQEDILSHIVKSWFNEVWLLVPVGLVWVFRKQVI